MTPGSLDHLLVALLALVVPLLGAREFRRMTAALKAGVAGVRARSYRRTIALQLAAGAAVLALWLGSARPLERLVSLTWLPVGWWTWAAWGATLLGCALLVVQVAALRRSRDALSKARSQLSSVEGILPHTPAELRLFLGLSLAAGVCEEIVYRGYLLAYFDAAIGPAGAVAGSTLLFGLGHAYQGLPGIVRTGLVGLVFAGVFLLTGSLLAPVLLHVVTDVTSGLVGYLALSSEPDRTTTSAVSPAPRSAPSSRRSPSPGTR